MRRKILVGGIVGAAFLLAVVVPVAASWQSPVVLERTGDGTQTCEARGYGLVDCDIQCMRGARMVVEVRSEDDRGAPPFIHGASTCAGVGANCIETARTCTGTSRAVPTDGKGRCFAVSDEFPWSRDLLVVRCTVA